MGKWLFLAVVGGMACLSAGVFGSVYVYGNANRFELVRSGDDRLYELDKKTGDLWRISSLSLRKYRVEGSSRESEK